VEAKGTLSSATLLDATSVEFKGDRLVGDDGDHVEIQGFITRFDSALDFDVSTGTKVACNTSAGCTVTTEGAPGGTLGLNIKVEVKGQYESGVLIATSVDIRLGKAIRVTARVDENVDVDAVSLVLLGITFDLTGNRFRFEDKSGQPNEASNISEIKQGDYLEVRGGVDGDGNLFAVIVELEELAVDVTPEFDTIIQGLLQDDPGALPFPPMSILDVIIMTNVNTVFEDENDNVINDPDIDFWPNVGAGSLIKAKGTMVTPPDTSVTPATPWTLLAEEVEIQVE